MMREKIRETIGGRIGSAARVGTSAVLVGMTAIVAASPLPASALTWNWSYVRAADPSGPAVEASGQLITTNSPDINEFYTITAVTGQRNAVAITSFIPTGSSIPGNCDTVSSCYESDNLVRLLGVGEGQLTTHGFGVSLADGTFANYFFASFLSPKVYLEYFSAPPFAPLPPGPEDSELVGAFLAQPVPGPLPLAGVVMGLRWSRRLRQRQRLRPVSRV
jgi:hypothetical protein